MRKHPTAKDLIAFLEGKLERHQAQAVVAHFLRGCTVCRETITKSQAQGRDLPGYAYDAAFERVFTTARKQAYRGEGRASGPSCYLEPPGYQKTGGERCPSPSPRPSAVSPSSP